MTWIFYSFLQYGTTINHNKAGFYNNLLLKEASKIPKKTNPGKIVLHFCLIWPAKRGK